MRILSRPTRPRALPIVALVSISLLGACGGGDEAATDDTTTTTTEHTTTTRESTTTAVTGEAPDEIAAVLADGRLVVLDAESGDVERTLLDGIRVDDPIKNGLAVTPDGDDVYVARPGPLDDGPEIVRVPMRGGQPEVIGPGRAPSISPDGSTLAYNDTEVRDMPPPAPFIVLRDLETGDERELRREDERQFHFIVETEWATGGEQLAWVAGEIKTALYVVDAEAEDLDGADLVGPGAGAGDDPAWRAIAPLEDGRMAVVELCCDIPDRERWTVITVDVDTGETEEGLLPQQRVEASDLDSDHSGRHVLVVVDRGVDGGSLMRWSLRDSGAEELETLREDVVVAAW